MQAEPQTVPDTIALLATLLRRELRLPELPPRVLVYNTNWDIPQTNDLFLVIGILADDNYGEGQGYSYDPVAQNLVENQIVARPPPTRWMPSQSRLRRDDGGTKSSSPCRGTPRSA